MQRRAAQLCACFCGVSGRRARGARREIGAAARGVSREPHSADIDAAVEPTNRTRHFRASVARRSDLYRDVLPGLRLGGARESGQGVARRSDLLVFGRCGTRSVGRGADDDSASRRPTRPPGRARAPDARSSGSPSGVRASSWEAHYLALRAALAPHITRDGDHQQGAAAARPRAVPACAW